MAKLGDVRRRFPPGDAAAYERAYEQARLAEQLGALVYGLRTAAGLTEAELAARMETDEEQVSRAEEGDASTSVELLDRVARAVGVRVRVSVEAGGLEVVLGAQGPPAPLQPTD